MNTRLFAARAALSVALLLPATAGAYVIQETEATNKELHYKVLPQKFFLSEEGADDIGGTGAFDAFVAAFDSWDAIEDSDARFSDFSAVDMNSSDIYVDDGDPGRDRKNLVAWEEDEWPADPAQLALTYAYYVETTGKILETDISMNGADYDWTAGDTGIESDVQSIAAHEIGHAFGLGHSEDSEATMFATAAQGETKKRTLSPDDMAAVRHLYPPGCCESTKAQEALAFFGCSMAAVPASAARGAAGALALAGLAGVALLRRRGRESSGVSGRAVRAALSRVGASAFVAILVAGSLAGTANASVARALSLEEMAVTAEAIVRGRVIHVQAIESPGGTIVTLAQVEVDEVLAGEAPDVVTVLEPGGEPGNGVGLFVSGAARFELGEEVVVFARQTRRAYEKKFPDTWRPVAMSQGKFRVVRDGTEARVQRDLSGVSRVVGTDGAWKPVTGDELSGLTLESLTARITRARTR